MRMIVIIVQALNRQLLFRPCCKPMIPSRTLHVSPVARERRPIEVAILEAVASIACLLLEGQYPMLASDCGPHPKMESINY